MRHLMRKTLHTTGNVVSCSSGLSYVSSRWTASKTTVDKSLYVVSPELTGAAREIRRLEMQHSITRKELMRAFEKVNEITEKKSNLKILDVGFGTGCCTEDMFNYFDKEKNKHIIIDAIDREQKWFDRCNSRFSDYISADKLHLHNIDLSNVANLSDYNNLTPDGNKYDIILCKFVLDHLFAKLYVRQAYPPPFLQRLFAVYKTRRSLFVSIPYPLHVSLDSLHFCKMFN